MHRLAGLLRGYGMRSDVTFNGSRFSLLLPAPIILAATVIVHHALDLLAVPLRARRCRAQTGMLVA